jgi:hypothetical protein
MTREVLKRDEEGNPVVVVYRESASEKEQILAERAEQLERATEVAASVRATR